MAMPGKNPVADMATIEEYMARVDNQGTNSAELLAAMWYVAKAYPATDNELIEDSIWCAYDLLRFVCGDRDLVWSARNAYRHVVAGI